MNLLNVPQLGMLLTAAFFAYSVPSQADDKVTLPNAFQQHLDGQNVGEIFAKQVRIPAKDRGFFSTNDITLEGTLYKPNGSGPFPLVILNHGSCFRSDCDATFKWTWMGKFYDQYNFVALAPMRRGRGKSEGSYAEPDSCGPGDQDHGLSNAIEDMDSIVAYAKTLPFVDLSKIVLLGVSRGGLLSLIYANKRPELAVVGTVSFVGGWTSDECDPVFNHSQFTELGKSSGKRAPSLWIYGENDRLWSNQSIDSYVRAFDKGDGKLTFRLHPVPGGDGHRIPQFSNLWESDLHQFMSQIGFRKK